MKEIHSQLCPVKRQKTLANAEAEKLKRLATSRVVTQVQSTQTASNAGPRAAAEVAPAAVASAASAPSGGGGGGGGSGPVKPGNTTVSLTVPANHAAAEGPIDMGFKSKRQPAGKFQGNSGVGPIRRSRSIGDMGYRRLCGL